MVMQKVLRLRHTRKTLPRASLWRNVRLCSWRDCRFSDPPLSLYDTCYRSVQSEELAMPH